MLLFYIFLLCCIIQLDIALLFLVRGGRKVISCPEDDNIGATVIICARNEAANLREFLPLILSQSHRDFEVLVVNDASSDDTLTVLSGFQSKYDNLKVINRVEGGKGKKEMLREAAVAARYDRLLLIDADCRPVGNRWLTLMVSPMSDGKEIVAGYGGYDAAPGLLNAVVRWETLHTWLQYSSWGRGGIPYMAVGRNMACTRSILLNAMQDPRWSILPAGDDDMLVSIAATKENYVVQDDPGAFTMTSAKRTWKEWYAQKKRHVSTGKYYRVQSKLVLGTYAASHAMGWCLLVVLLFTPAAATAVWLWLARCVLLWLAMARAARAVGESGIIPMFPLFDIGWMMYNFALLPYITWKNKTTWT